MKKVILSLLITLLVSGMVSAQKSKESPLGIWTNEAQEARFEIFNCGNDKLCGKIIWLKEPDRNGKPKMDEKNPDSKNRNRPIVGMVFMKGFEYDEDGKWDDGTIYDPSNGKTYSCYIKMIGKDKMEVKGYIGFSVIGRSQTWSRIN